MAQLSPYEKALAEILKNKATVQIFNMKELGESGKEHIFVTMNCLRTVLELEISYILTVFQ